MHNDFISFYHVSLSLKSHLNEICQTNFKTFFCGGLYAGSFFKMSVMIFL